MMDRGVMVSDPTIAIIGTSGTILATIGIIRTTFMPMYIRMIALYNVFMTDILCSALRTAGGPGERAGMERAGMGLRRGKNRRL